MKDAMAKEVPSLPMREAQTAHLRTVFETTSESRKPLRRGDFVRYREGTGPFLFELTESMVLMFWRSLDKQSAEDVTRIQNANDIERTTLPHIDCLVVCFTGEQLNFWLASEELLEVVDP